MRPINVSVVYATPTEQWLFEISLRRGESAMDALSACNLAAEIPELADANLAELKLGVFSEKVDGDYLMQEGDRLEIYRPLLADPKEVRRQLAALGKTMGKGRNLTDE